MITLLKTRASLTSLGPGPRQGPTAISYSDATAPSYQPSASAGPLAVNSSPWTEQDIFRNACQKTFALPLPCANPRRTSSVLHSSCHPFAAGRVPYMWRRSSPLILPRSGSSGRRSTKLGEASRWTFALKYALRTSRQLICWRLGEPGSQMGWWPPHLVIAKLRIVRKASSGGAGAKYDAPDESQA